MNSQIKKNSAWPVKNIKIYNNNNKKEITEFKNKNKENFFLVKYVDILIFLKKYVN